ncbi:chaperone modulator CbpM [Pseudohongiella sp.]|uniref:Chaperone modulatory protein CbpM n=1 Tax=marine sediment metagenome TaxID=412755 RepID=A0A0F9YFE1_9ZZZZ|nr:chaperone modulator CbpM [Pseudohongiella sp.]HDZ08327.1 chaperone modulatory protein CbpM [Pseudohongiella sp.]HEA62603.1 chaperone modulatory protein CbpM [Pseudohongiella sp.]
MDIHITLQEVCSSTGLSRETVIDIVDHGIVEPQGDRPELWRFDDQCLCIVQRARRLREDLELNWQGIALVIELLEHRDRLKTENEALLRRLQRFDSHQS